MRITHEENFYSPGYKNFILNLVFCNLLLFMNSNFNSRW